MLHLFVKNVDEMNLLGDIKTGQLYNAFQELEETSWHYTMAVSAAMSGDMKLVLIDSDLNEDVSATDLNTAKAGEFKRTFILCLQTADGGKHVWADFAPILTPAENVAAGAVGAPTLPAGLKFENGLLLAEVTFKTDEGVTMIYVAGEDLTIPIQTKADDTLLGWPVTSLLKQYDVVA